MLQTDVDQARGLVTIAINDSYRLAPWADYHYFCDAKWWRWHNGKPEYREYTGTRICHDDVPEPGVHQIKGGKEQGISFDPGVVNTGSNSGFQALNIAVLMGASRILLLGYDMKVGGKGHAHWFGDHPDGVRSNYTGWLSNYSIAADQLKEHGVEVINCSLDTALSCFPKMSLESALSLEQAQALRASS